MDEKSISNAEKAEGTQSEEQFKQEMANVAARMKDMQREYMFPLNVMDFWSEYRYADEERRDTALTFMKIGLDASVAGFVEKRDKKKERFTAEELKKYADDAEQLMLARPFDEFKLFSDPFTLMSDIIVQSGIYDIIDYFDDAYQYCENSTFGTIGEELEWLEDNVKTAAPTEYAQRKYRLIDCLEALLKAVEEYSDWAEPHCITAERGWEEALDSVKNITKKLTVYYDIALRRAKRRHVHRHIISSRKGSHNPVEIFLSTQKKPGKDSENAKANALYNLNISCTDIKEFTNGEVTRTQEDALLLVTDVEVYMFTHTSPEEREYMLTAVEEIVTYVPTPYKLCGGLESIVNESLGKIGEAERILGDGGFKNKEEALRPILELVRGNKAIGEEYLKYCRGYLEGCDESKYYHTLQMLSGYYDMAERELKGLSDKLSALEEKIKASLGEEFLSGVKAGKKKPESAPKRVNAFRSKAVQGGWIHYTTEEIFEAIKNGHLTDMAKHREDALKNLLCSERSMDYKRGRDSVNSYDLDDYISDCEVYLLLGGDLKDIDRAVRLFGLIMEEKTETHQIGYTRDLLFKIKVKVDNSKEGYLLKSFFDRISLEKPTESWLSNTSRTAKSSWTW